MTRPPCSEPRTDNGLGWLCVGKGHPGKNVGPSACKACKFVPAEFLVQLAAMPPDPKRDAHIAKQMGNCNGCGG